VKLVLLTTSPIIIQTRGWFYTLLVLSTALFNKPPFKNLIVNGLVLAAYAPSTNHSFLSILGRRRMMTIVVAPDRITMLIDLLKLILVFASIISFLSLFCRLLFTYLPFFTVMARR
jgi:hypothetical protein